MHGDGQRFPGRPAAPEIIRTPLLTKPTSSTGDNTGEPSHCYFAAWFDMAYTMERPKNQAARAELAAAALAALCYMRRKTCVACGHFRTVWCCDSLHRPLSAQAAVVPTDGLNARWSASVRWTLHPDGTKPVAKSRSHGRSWGRPVSYLALSAGPAVGPPRPGRHSAQRLARLPAPRKVGAG